MHIKLIYESSKDYVVANALINIWYKSKGEYQKEMPSKITQTLCTMFISEIFFEDKMKESYVNDDLTQ